ncbi:MULTISPECIES: SAF domain-containing protein [unclassified Psychrobacillus]|uniref:SAF domain-containing protein n=1 Tax=unclassified Psychrobacillus TaxID=2636677 RepID=UPI0030F831EF
MSIRLRTKKLIWSGLIGAGIMLIIATVGGYFYYDHVQERELALKKEYKKKMELLQKTAEQNEQGYALTADVERGEVITKEMLVEVSLPELAKAENTMSLPQFDATNYYARTDLKANTVIIDSLVYMDENIENDIREAEYSLIELPSKLKAADYVDIRIQFPNGDDYILFAKKKVKEVAGLTVWMDNDEAEILSMSSAIVDAYIEGAKIYALPYVDGEMQIGSQITYPVKQNVLSLIQSSPNIVNIAKLNLEKQNRANLEMGLEAMEEEERQKLRAGEESNKAAVEEQKQIDELNALNQFNQVPPETTETEGVTGE